MTPLCAAIRMHNDQTDLERLVHLSRRRFIGAGALAGAALFLGGGLLGRSALADAVSEASGNPLIGFANIPASTADTALAVVGRLAARRRSGAPRTHD